MQAHKVTDGGGGSPSEFNLVSQVKRQISTPQVYFRKVQWRYIPITKTKGNGRQQQLEDVHTWLFKKENVDPNVPLRIKFAFDGARVTVKQKQMQVVGTVELLSGKTVQEIKSASNAHQWIIYLGSETNEDLKKELDDALPILRSIFRDESVIN